jgi:hypothetical protein
MQAQKTLPGFPSLMQEETLAQAVGLGLILQ